MHSLVAAHSNCAASQPGPTSRGKGINNGVITLAFFSAPVLPYPIPLCSTSIQHAIQKEMQRTPDLRITVASNADGKLLDSVMENFHKAGKSKL